MDLSIPASNPYSKVNGANIGPTGVLSVPDGPYVGPMNLAIRMMYDTVINITRDKLFDIFHWLQQKFPRTTLVLSCDEMSGQNKNRLDIVGNIYAEVFCYIIIRNFFLYCPRQNASLHENQLRWWIKFVGNNFVTI